MFAFNQSGFKAKLCRPNGCHITARASADDQNIVCAGHFRSLTTLQKDALRQYSSQHCQWVFDQLFEGLDQFGAECTINRTVIG